MGRRVLSERDLAKPVLFNVIICTVFFCAGVVPAAHAYLDPGTGSFILQTLIAALFGALFVLKSYWARLKGWFSGREPEENTSSTGTADDGKSQKPDSSEGITVAKVDSKNAGESAAKLDE